MGRYVKLLKLALQQHQDTPQRIRTAVNEGRYSDAMQLAHSLKSVSANIGASRTSELAQELEKTLKDAEKNGVTPHLSSGLAEQVEIAWQSAKSSAEDFVNRHTA